MTVLLAVLATALQGCGVAAEQDATTTATVQRKIRPPPPQVPDGNPLATLASALVAVVLYILQVVQSAVTFVTIDIPT